MRGHGVFRIPRGVRGGRPPRATAQWVVFVRFGIILPVQIIRLKGLKTPENPHFDIVKSERTGDAPNMGTRLNFERGGHGQRDGAFRNRITCAIRKLWLVKVEN